MPTLFKKCTTCKKKRDAEKEFHYNGQYYSGGLKKKRTDCIYCCRKRRSDYFKDPVKRLQINKRRRRHYQSDGGARRERNRRNSLKALYGITIEQYEQKRIEQNFMCAICFIHESKAPKSKLYVDHCHKSGKVRGLLCARCNSAIGLFNEDLGAMKRALQFLMKLKNKK